MKNNDERPIGYILRIYDNGKMVRRYDTSKYVRFISLTRLINWKKGITVYLRVNYYDYKDFHNDMTCFSKKDLDWGIKSFITEYL